jgi:antitoxin component YwqK of YwqJK toxin-antitoxin module
MKRPFSLIIFILIFKSAFSWQCAGDQRSFIEYISTIEPDEIIIVHCKFLRKKPETKAFDLIILKTLWGERILPLIELKTDSLIQLTSIKEGQEWILFIHKNQKSEYFGAGYCDQYSFLNDGKKGFKLKLKAIEEIIDIRKDKRTTKEKTFFFDENKIAAKGKFTKGLRDGHWTYWDMEWGAGKILYFKEEELDFKVGIRNGLWIGYRTNDAIYLKAMLKDDTVQSQIQYHKYPDQPSIILIRKDDGSIVNKHFNQAGQLETVYLYHEKTYYGPKCQNYYIEQYYPNSQLEYKGTYKDCQKLDDWKYFTEDGKPMPAKF